MASMQLPLDRTVKLQHSFKFQGANIWNNIPKLIKDLTYAKFKSEFKSHLVQNHFI